MATVIYRSQLNAPLTCAQLDNNWTAVLDRANHTGVQPASSIYDLYTTVKGYDFITALQTCCSTLTAGLAQLQADVFGSGQLSNLLNNLRNEILGDIAGVNTSITNLAARVTALETGNGTTGSSLASLSSSLTALTALLNLKANIASPTFTGQVQAPTPPSTSNDNTVATTAFVHAAGVPIGTIFMFPMAQVPDSTYLLCDGSAVSRTTYPTLFNMLGIAYGPGDGSTTFNIPNFQGRFPVGQGNNGQNGFSVAEYGGQGNIQLDVAHLPSHTHTPSDPGHNHTITDNGTHHHVIPEQGYGGVGSGGNISLGGQIVTEGAIKQADNNDVFTGRNTLDATVNVSIAPATTGITLGNTGGGQSFQIYPPFLGISFVMKAL